MEALPLGMLVTMKSGIAYALPAVKCTLTADGAATFNQSNNAGFTGSGSVTLSNQSVTLSGGFLKASADTVVILKRD